MIEYEECAKVAREIFENSMWLKLGKRVIGAAPERAKQKQPSQLVGAGQGALLQQLRAADMRRRQEEAGAAGRRIGSSTARAGAPMANVRLGRDEQQGEAGMEQRLGEVRDELSRVFQLKDKRGGLCSASPARRGEVAPDLARETGSRQPGGDLLAQATVDDTSRLRPVSGVRPREVVMTSGNGAYAPGAFAVSSNPTPQSANVCFVVQDRAFSATARHI
jgi:hypothetical protein